jgi:outer membrane lipoprotein-sorting protein
MKKILAVIIFLLFFFVTGCSIAEDKENIYQKINSRLIKMKTYKTDAELKYISNKNINTYNALMHCDIKGPYRIEIISPENSVGNVTVFNGKQIYQFNSNINARIKTITKETSERSEIFLSSFIKNYNQSMETSVSVCKIEKKPCTILETKIPGENNYLNSEKLFLDNQTFDPVKLIILDKENIERIIVKFSNFEYNANLSPNVFRAK